MLYQVYLFSDFFCLLVTNYAAYTTMHRSVYVLLYCIALVTSVSCLLCCLYLLWNL